MTRLQGDLDTKEPSGVFLADIEAGTSLTDVSTRIAQSILIQCFN
jgi:hypothetical protein